jgi:hypothetical protein
VVWAVIVLAIGIHERPRPLDYDALASKYGGKPVTLNEVLDATPYSTQALVQYWATRSAAMVLPPVTGYLFFFYVLPWIVRGFASSDSDVSK